MKLLIVVNVDWFFVSHRLEVAQEAVKRGWEVHVATTLTGTVDALNAHGFHVHPIKVDRSSTNPIGLLGTVKELRQLFRRIQPDVVHLVTIKPVLCGGLAARTTGMPAVVYAISGLGHVFTAKGVVGFIRKQLVRLMYKSALKVNRKTVIFQNTEDRRSLEEIGSVTRAESTLIPGSGVDVESYDVTELPQDKPVFLMASRLIRSKGVMEYSEAAALLHAEGIEAEFWLAGAADHQNPEGLTEKEIQEISNAGHVQLLGHRRDVPKLMERSSIVVLPSYYGEGLPKVLIEASAAGRPIITTDTPGCRDAIENGLTGLLVEERNVADLANAMRRFATNNLLQEQMGANGRRRAESRFRIQDVVNKHIEIYDDLARSA